MHVLHVRRGVCVPQIRYFLALSLRCGIFRRHVQSQVSKTVSASRTRENSLPSPMVQRLSPCAGLWPVGSDVLGFGSHVSSDRHIQRIRRVVRELDQHNLRRPGIRPADAERRYGCTFGRVATGISDLYRSLVHQRPIRAGRVRGSFIRRRLHWRLRSHEYCGKRCMLSRRLRSDLFPRQWCRHLFHHLRLPCSRQR
jgi:hypothetical protein